jgi:cell division protein FtsL
MSQRLRKYTILLLAALLLFANIVADFAHQHDSYQGRHFHPEFSPISSKLPKSENLQKVCLACLFTSEHNGLLSAITIVLTSSPSVATKLPTRHFFAQFNEAPARNRAPPLAW